jgi:hypothetical protein
MGPVAGLPTDMYRNRRMMASAFAEAIFRSMSYPYAVALV